MQFMIGILFSTALESVQLPYSFVKSILDKIASLNSLLVKYNGVIKRDETRKIFNLPETVIPICFIDLGFQPTDNRVNLSSAKRNPLESMVTLL